MFCPKCDKEIEDGSVECPFCGIIISKYKPPKPFAPEVRRPESEKSAPAVSIPYVKIGLAVFGIILLWIMLRPEHAPELRAVSARNNESVTLSCDTKERCVIAYLAPW